MLGDGPPFARRQRSGQTLFDQPAQFVQLGENVVERVPGGMISGSSHSPPCRNR